MSENKKTDEQPLRQLIDKMLGAYGLQGRLDERQLMNVWEKIVGQMISKHTTDLKLKKNVLYISLDSATIRQELDYAKDQLKEQINKEMGKEIVSELVLK